MRKPLLLLFLLLFSLSSFAKTILVMGDSLSAGYGLSDGEEWPALLQNKLGKNHTVVNASISGETTQGGLQRFAALMQTHQPHIVILELGANDGLRGQSLKQMKSNLSQMIEQSKQQQATTLLLGVRIPPNYGERYSQAFHQVYFDLQQQYKLSLVPFFLEGVAGDASLMQKDALHPTADAQPIILENIWKNLAELLK